MKLVDDFIGKEIPDVSEKPRIYMIQDANGFGIQIALPQSVKLVAPIVVFELEEKPETTLIVPPESKIILPS